jgi:hypothetical protein
MEWLNLAVPDRRKRDDHHVESIEKSHVLDQHHSGGSANQDYGEPAKRQFQATGPR